MIRVETHGKDIECEIEGTALDIITDVTLVLVHLIRKMTTFPGNKNKAKKFLQTMISSIYKTACERLEVDP